jgi:hypothetical protein
MRGTKLRVSRNVFDTQCHGFTLLCCEPADYRNDECDGIRSQTEPCSEQQ